MQFTAPQKSAAAWGAIAASVISSHAFASMMAWLTRGGSVAFAIIGNAVPIPVALFGQCGSAGGHLQGLAQLPGQRPVPG